jgi:beta-carotene hydroxylase
MLKHKADIKTLVYLTMTTAMLFFQWHYGFHIISFIVSLYLAITVAIIAHNHNHLPLWESKGMNHFTDYWITLFYGFPAFGWIPTHNRNHHKFNNKEGDYTITYRVSEKNNIFTLLSYPGISSYYQQSPIMNYLRHLWVHQRFNFFMAIGQYLALGVLLAVTLYLDWKKAVLFVIIPHQVALFSVLIFNYVQHVHADEESDYNHSRNFVSKFSGFMTFNNGLHTVHHMRANTHWSELREAHDKVAHLIEPHLNQKTIIGYLVKTYIIGPFISSFRTKSMRLARKRGEQTLA